MNGDALPVHKRQLIKGPIGRNVRPFLVLSIDDIDLALEVQSGAGLLFRKLGVAG
jgi:hypothetical protein